MGNGTFKYKQQCPQCLDTGMDNLGVYEEGGKLDGYCFSCNYTIKDMAGRVVAGVAPSPLKTPSTPLQKASLEQILTYPSVANIQRKIPEEINRFYGVRQHSDATYYPYYESGELRGYKIRIQPKDFSRSHSSISGCGFFGQQLFNGGQSVVIVEGEEDALAAYHMLKEGGHTMPVVAMPGSSQVKAMFSREMLWLDNFQKIIICFDNDEAGTKAAKESANFIDPIKFCKVILEEKDASDMCVKGKWREFTKAITSATTEPIKGVLQGDAIWDAYSNAPEYKFVKFPKDWEVKAHGFTAPSLNLLIAGTGVGKSSVAKALQLNMWAQSDEKIGIITLEEPVPFYLRGMLGMHIGQRLSDPTRKIVFDEAHRQQFQQVFGKDRFVICDTSSVQKPDDLYKIIRYMVKGCGVKYIWLDHLTALLNKMGASSSNIDKAEMLIATINSLTIELNCGIILLAQTKKAEKKDTQNRTRTFEEGAIPSEDDILGTSAIKQHSFLTLAIVRDKRDSFNNGFFLHTLKDRATSQTGASKFVRFDNESGRLYV